MNNSNKSLEQNMCLVEGFQHIIWALKSDTQIKQLDKKMYAFHLRTKSVYTNEFQ